MCMGASICVRGLRLHGGIQLFVILVFRGTEALPRSNYQAFKSLWIVCTFDEIVQISLPTLSSGFEPMSEICRYANRARMDIKANQYKSCALVGRNPMIKLSKTGHSVNQNEAIWRFNLDTPSGSEEYVGNKTTVRILNQGSANKADGKKVSWHPGEREVGSRGLVFAYSAHNSFC